MSSIPTIERTSGITPAWRRDRAHSPPAGDDQDGRDRRPGKGPRDDELHQTPAADAPATPHTTVGHIVNTFARSGKSSTRYAFPPGAVLSIPESRRHATHFSPVPC